MTVSFRSKSGRLIEINYHNFAIWYNFFLTAAIFLLLPVLCGRGGGQCFCDYNCWVSIGDACKIPIILPRRSLQTCSFCFSWLHVYIVLFYFYFSGTNNHVGNELFRQMVNQKKCLYLHSSKRDKPSVSKGIVHSIRGLNPPGRFLQRDEQTGLW